MKRKTKSNKNQITKIDIARWIAVLPATLFAFSIYATITLEFLYKFLSYFTNENRSAQIVSLSDAIILPAIIVSCGYFISPKFKFRTALILVILFLAIQIIHLIEPSEYTKFSPRLILWIASYIIGLSIAYKFDNKK